MTQRTPLRPGVESEIEVRMTARKACSLTSAALELTCLVQDAWPDYGAGRPTMETQQVHLMNGPLPMQAGETTTLIRSVRFQIPDDGQSRTDWRVYIRFQVDKWPAEVTEVARLNW